MRILVVEDDHEIADSIKKGLQDNSYAVDVAYDGTTGFDLASTENYDVIVLDWMLPGLSGIEICARLRKERIATPILFLTSRSQLDDKVEGLSLGADDFLVKPFAFAELLARIKALIRRPKVVLQPRLQVGDLTVNTITYEVSRQQQQIHLSHTEFALLEYLMTHAGKVISKRELIGHVWDFDANILPNTVETYIGYLRNKIDKPFAKPLIHTVKGFGYVLKEEENVKVKT
jgi:DNA-binding response OmpR family regulator